MSDEFLKELQNSVAKGTGTSLGLLCMLRIVHRLNTIHTTDGFEGFYKPEYAFKDDVMVACSRKMDTTLAALREHYQCHTDIIPGGKLLHQHSIDRHSICILIQKSFPRSVSRGLKTPALNQLSNPFDVCASGNHISNNWESYECADHLGPCCGNGHCDKKRGETAVNCHRDCGGTGRKSGGQVPFTSADIAKAHLRKKMTHPASNWDVVADIDAKASEKKQNEIDDAVAGLEKSTFTSEAV